MSATDDLRWVDEVYTADDLADAAAILYGATHSNGNGQHDTSGESWQPLKASAFLQLPEPKGNELLGQIVLRGGRTIVGGDSGHGKTTLAFAMISAIVKGTELLGWQGAGLGPALIIDLEQGVRSIKRGIRSAEFDDNVYILNLPDGLALDQNPSELLRLEEAIVTLEPTVISLDPYYKAHRGDANEERAVTDLMRNLDRLRSEYSFALLLPAHVRKDIQGGGVRKLTLADIAGSGAISRGAEIVLGIERLAHGTARLRFLKDREGELPVGEHLDVTFSQENGFAVTEHAPEESIEQLILAVVNSGWLTVDEWREAIGKGTNETRRTLNRLAAVGQILYEVGPFGRSKTAKCYSTTGLIRLDADSESSSVDQVDLRGSVGDSTTRPTTPLGVGSESTGTPPESEELDSTPDDDIELP